MGGELYIVTKIKVNIDNNIVARLILMTGLSVQFMKAVRTEISTLTVKTATKLLALRVTRKYEINK